MIKEQITLKGLLFIVLVLFSATTVLAQPSMWKNYSFNWVDHTPNPRFAIHDPGTPSDESDDLVLDKMTGLIWMRNGGYLGTGINWVDAVQLCRNDITVGNIKGWRLPTIEEISSLIDANNTAPSLPLGHPFVNVCTTWYYWSNTTYEGNSTQVWYISFNDSTTAARDKSDELLLWAVLGGSGYASGNW